MPWWVTVLSSITSAIIGGIFTMLVGKKNRKLDKQKYLNDLNLKANETKPRLEIKNYRGFVNASEYPNSDSDCDLIALGIMNYKDNKGRSEFYYDEKALDLNNLVRVKYEFVNSGKTEIEEICIVSNLPESMSIFNFERKDKFIKNKLLNYDVWIGKKYLKENATFTLCIYYLNKQIPTTNLGRPELVLWLRDVNGRYWSQILNSPYDEVEISKLRTEKDFKESIDIQKAIECFRNPMMW